MPKIYLKPNSAEFAEGTEKPPAARCCDMPGCVEEADFRAPKDRSLSEYYRFCLTHVQEYNKAWDYFSGMSPADIEQQILRSALWDRPTRRYDGYANLEDMLKTKAWQTYHYTDKEPEKDKGESYRTPFERNSPEYEAMAIMELQPPLSLPKIKERYKALAKKHHPDLNRGDPKSEELLKRINMAYTILKLAYEKYEQLGK